MKCTLLRLILLIVACGGFFPSSAQTSAATHPGTLAADTVVGEAQLTRLFSRRLCEQIALESRHQDFTVLTRPQAMGLLETMLMAVIIRDSAEFTAFILRAPDEAAAVQRLSVQAVLSLSTACPAAYTLLTKMGDQMAGLDTNLSGPQQKAVQAAAQDLCGQLTTEDATRALSRRTAAERMELYNQARLNVIRAHGQAIVLAFGDQLLTDKQLEDNMWKNVDRLMFEACPAISGLLRVDWGMRKIPDQSATAPPTSDGKPAPARRNRKK